MSNDAKTRRKLMEDLAAEEEDEEPALAKWITQTKQVFSIWTGGGLNKNAEEEKMENLAAVIRTYRDPAEEDDAEEDKVWVDRSKFELCICALILLNMLAMTLELDYAQQSDGGRHMGWTITEAVLCGLFGLEILLKARYHSWRWLYADAWNATASAILLCLVINVAILVPTTGSGQLRLVSLFRLPWLLRFGKTFQVHQSLEDMQLLIQGLMESFRVLVWAFMLLAIFIYIWAVLLTRQIGLNEELYGEYRKASGGWDHEEYFGTVAKSMYTLVQCMSLDGWSSQIGRHVVNNQVIMAAFFICFMLLTTFGLLNIIVSIIVENILETSLNNQTKLRVREERARRLELESIREVFLISDADGNGTLDINEYLEAAQSPEVQWRMRQLELPAQEAARLFEVMDGSGSRVLTIDEFIRGCAKLKGAAQSRDMLAIQAQADTLVRKLDAMADNLSESERLMGALDEVSKRISRRFDSAVEGSRRKLAQTVGGAKPLVPPKRHGPGGPKVPLAAGNQPVLPLFPDLLR